LAAAISPVKGATTMLRLKKVAGPRTKLQKHNNQDTRVTVDGRSSPDKKSKGELWKAMLREVRSFLIRQLLIDAWSNRHEYWEKACEVASKILEAVIS
jgi:hypothetical protein